MKKTTYLIYFCCLFFISCEQNEVEKGLAFNYIGKFASTTLPQDTLLAERRNDKDGNSKNYFVLKRKGVIVWESMIARYVSTENTSKKFTKAIIQFENDYYIEIRQEFPDYPNLRPYYLNIKKPTLSLDSLKMKGYESYKAVED